MPQNLSPFQISGRRTFEEVPSPSHTQFAEQTGIWFAPNCGIDASVFNDEWHGASVMTEVVIADFQQVRANAQTEKELEENFELSEPVQGCLFPFAA